VSLHDWAALVGEPVGVLFISWVYHILVNKIWVWYGVIHGWANGWLNWCLNVGFSCLEKGDLEYRKWWAGSRIDITKRANQHGESPV